MTMPPLENLCPDFSAFWEEASCLFPAEQKRLWRSLYEDRHRAVFDVYDGHFGNREELDRALTRFPAVVADLRAVAGRVERAAADVVPGSAALFHAPVGAVPIVVLVGLFCSDAWVWPLRGAWTAFLAAEMIARTAPRRLRAIVAHEAAHALRARCLELATTSAAIAATRSVGFEAFAEGLAVVASARVVAGAGEAAYLNLGPDGRAWSAACGRLWPSLRRAFLAALERTDPDVLATYFRADERSSPAAAPARAGYFVGHRVVDTLTRRHPVAEMARWPVERCVAELGRALEQMTELPPGEEAPSFAEDPRRHAACLGCSRPREPGPRRRRAARGSCRRPGPVGSRAIASSFTPRGVLRCNIVERPPPGWRTERSDGRGRAGSGPRRG